MNELTIDGVRYVAQGLVNGYYGCDGCAAEGNADLCEKLTSRSSCEEELRSDKRAIIWWTKSNPAEAWLVPIPGRVPDRAVFLDRSLAEAAAVKHHSVVKSLVLGN